MRFTSNINNVKASEWKLSISEAYLFSWFYELPSWAEKVYIDGQDYYFASRLKAIEELPLLTTKPDTMYRYYKALEEKGLVSFIKVGNKDYVKLTPLGRTWNSWQSDRSEENPKNLGKLSEKASEKNPTYNSTIKDNTTNIKKGHEENEIEKPFKSEQFAKAWDEWILYRKQKKVGKYTTIGLKKTFKELQHLSQNNEVAAIKILEQSMAKGWQGIFALKNAPVTYQSQVNREGKLTYQQELEKQRSGYTPIGER